MPLDPDVKEPKCALVDDMEAIRVPRYYWHIPALPVPDKCSCLLEMIYGIVPSGTGSEPEGLIV